MGNFKDFFKQKVIINTETINKEVDFESVESCRHFLNTLWIAGRKVEAINLTNGETVKMKDIPDDQVIQRAKEIRASIYGKAELA